MTLPKHLADKRDELAEEYKKCLSDEIDRFDSKSGTTSSLSIQDPIRLSTMPFCRIINMRDFEAGFDAAVKLMSEAAPEFDEKEADKKIAQEIHRLLPEVPERISAVQSVSLIRNLLRWQYNQLSALLAARDAEIARLKADHKIVLKDNGGTYSVQAIITTQKESLLEQELNKWKAMALELAEAVEGLEEASEALAKLEEMKKPTG